MHQFLDLIFAANVTHDVDSIVCLGLRPSGKFSDKYHITMCPPNPNFAPPRSSIAFVHTNMKNYMEITINLDLKYSITARQHLYTNTNTDIHKKMCLITSCPHNLNIAPRRSSMSFVHTNMTNYMEIPNKYPNTPFLMEY